MNTYFRPDDLATVIMLKQNHKKTPDQIKSTLYPEELRLLSRQILQAGNSGLTRTYFLRKILMLLCDFFKADAINVLLRAFDDPNRSELAQYNQETFTYNFYPQANTIESRYNASTELDEHWKHILTGSMDASLSFVTKKGSFWIRDIAARTSGQEIL
ncbi:MAG: hypothetical protein KAT15_02420, partial [Bacteroidales bacterium]|nr:hypothetical protein [Bacteroidales bacterium]